MSVCCPVKLQIRHNAKGKHLEVLYFKKKKKKKLPAAGVSYPLRGLTES